MEDLFFSRCCGKQKNKCILKDIKQMEDGLSKTIKHDRPDVLPSSEIPEVFFADQE